MGATHSASATGHRADRRADDQDLSAKGLLEAVPPPHHR
jgi:hypothetical protein